jgi:hypothetical protein
MTGDGPASTGPFDTVADLGEPPPPPVVAPPGALAVVGTALELNVAASRSIRDASLYAGAMFVLLLGPAALIVALLIANGALDRFDVRLVGEVGFLRGPAAVTVVLGTLATLAVSIDLQIIAIALIDSQAEAVRLDLRRGLAVARRRFWPLIGASVLVGLIDLVVGIVLSAVLPGREPDELSSRFGIDTLVDLVVGLPFAYVGAAVVLGGGGPVGAVRMSISVARRRWRLAAVIGIVNTATAVLAGFAIDAGGDILGRAAIALGIGDRAGPIQILGLAAITAFAIAALGSLTMTIGALSAAPQVVAYRALAGPRSAVEPVDAAASRRASLITIGMAIVIVLLALTAAGAIVGSPAVGQPA